MIRSFAEWFEQAEAGGIGLAEVVERREVKETGVSREAVRKRIADALAVMRHAVDEGLAIDEPRRPGSRVDGRAGWSQRGRELLGDDFTAMLSRAIATLETNARMGLIMATPTAGAAGVVPAVLLTLAPVPRVVGGAPGGRDAGGRGTGISHRRAGLDLRAPEADARRRPEVPRRWRRPP